jgi:hypothetical protein
LDNGAGRHSFIEPIEEGDPAAGRREKWRARIGNARQRRGFELIESTHHQLRLIAGRVREARTSER